MKILALIGDRPNPPINGSRVRNAFLWPAIARTDGIELRVLGLDYRPELDEAPSISGVEAEFFPLDRGGAPQRVHSAFFHSYHTSQRSAALGRRLDELVATWKPDVIHSEELRMSHYLPGARGKSAGETIQSVTFHNVESDLYRAIGSSAFPVAKRLSKSFHIWNLERFERAAIRACDIAFAYSTRDRERYERLIPGPKWSETRNGADVQGVIPAPQPATGDFLLVATWSYWPNRVGLIWLLDEVIPRLPASAKITVAGSGADDELKQKLAKASVTFVDTPRELRPLYDSHAVVVVPVLEGSGTRGKILEALAYERVVVTTTKGPEGLELAEGEGIVIADGAEPFTKAMADVMMSPELRASIARRGREAVMTRYDWSVVAEELIGAWKTTRCTSR